MGAENAPTGTHEDVVALQRTAAHERIDHDLTNHPPDPDQIARMEHLRELAKLLAHELVENCAPGRELSVALTSVEQACMYGVAAIAREH